jgi:hypothetical protein
MACRAIHRFEQQALAISVASAFFSTRRIATELDWPLDRGRGER